MKMGRKLAYEIVRGGGVVGAAALTSGVDAAAARGALLAGGRCVGVGTPHECEAGTLAAEVAARGALISEYPPGTKPEKHFFRDRNRIAAGLSVGVTVVEAPERSGARLFAETAMEQGREIFAVPGNADAPTMGRSR
ncbi:MAG: DNA-processing protein DprA [Oscillospiraceae bacterium]